MEATKSHILITGANGFIGAHLCGHLAAQGHTITACVRFQSDLSELRRVLLMYGVDLETLLLTKIDDIESVDDVISSFGGDTVVHTAAYVNLSGHHIKTMDRVNVRGTAVVAESCFIHHKKLIYLSSIAALGDVWLPSESIDSSSQWQPDKYHSAYGISKMRAQLEVHSFIEEGLNALILCPGVVFGAGFEKSGGNPILHYLMASSRPYCPNSGNLPWVAVDKINQVCSWALTQPSFSRKPLILLDGQDTYSDFYASVFAYLDKRFRLKFISRQLMVSIVALLAPLRRIGIRTQWTKDFVNSTFDTRIYGIPDLEIARNNYSISELMRYLNY